jgi:hypothetical protein
MNNVSNHKGTIMQKARLSVRGKILMTCLSPRAAERGGGRGGLPQVLGRGPLEFFCWAPVIFLG